MESHPVMKSALPILALILSVALTAAGAEPGGVSPASRSAKAAPGKCSRCAHAPCRCGFSPSYYTNRKKPVRLDTAKHAPIVPHWTRPQRVAVRPPTRGVAPTPRPPGAVPAVAPRQLLGYAPARRARTAYRRPCAAPTRGTTLVPTPRRPRAVPASKPRQSLGYVPSASWSRGIVDRRVRR